MPMKLSRLIQPRNPLFWLMLVFNLLSSGFAWALRSYPLNAAGFALIGSLAVANAVVGLWLAWRLVRGDGGRDEAARRRGDEPPDPGR